MPHPARHQKNSMFLPFSDSGKAADVIERRIVKTTVRASTDASPSMLNSNPRASLTSYAALLGALLSATAGTACAGATGSPTFNDGVGTVMQNASTAADTGSAPTSNTPPVADTEQSAACTDEGCACDQAGATTQCAGPKIHTGDYTSCAPGNRTCTNGAWGACVVKTLYTNSDTLTQDYSSTCGADSSVHWGTVDLTGKTPGGATVDVFVQTAASQTLLDKGTMVHVTEFQGASSTSWTSPDVGAALVAAGVAPAAWLRITLSVTSPNAATPAQVAGWRQETTCVPQ